MMAIYLALDRKSRWTNGASLVAVDGGITVNYFLSQYRRHR